eukprot:TRINITY_DN4130_c0_g3_i2.p1 TRINITY_DN4130_c0_g3~~TRINITY_DN4130_c0_g3_i2.p1  ORF type:complete len:221 (-),score=29.72 TRINITY_DN4130_c0_g3_i2:324-986(-)
MSDDHFNDTLTKSACDDVRSKYLSRLGIAMLNGRPDESFRRCKSMIPPEENKYFEIPTERCQSAKLESTPTDSMVFILDWDDTLFCSSFYFENETHLLFPHVKELSHREAKLVQKMASMGEVHIVSNATEDWISRSGKKFLPELWATLQEKGGKVISAQTKFKHLSADDPREWKKKAFEEIFDERTGKSSQERVKFVAVGDSKADIDASNHLKQYNLSHR